MGESNRFCGCSGKEGSAANFEKLDNVIDLYRNKPGSLIQVLHLAQEIFGYLPVEVLEHISREMDVPIAEIAGVVSFYSFFSTEPRGKHSIKVCMGTACYVRGGQKLVEGLMERLAVELGQITEDGKFSLEVARCIGACGLAPAVMIDDKVYREVKVSELDDILSKY